MGYYSREDIFIVAGASSGIGRAVAENILEEGGSVIALGRNKQRLVELANQNIGKPLFIEIVDLVKKVECMPQFLKELKDKYGKFAGLAYCAGKFLLKPSSIVNYSECVDLFNINYFVPYLMIKSFCDKRICIADKASVVAISSAAAKLKDKGLSVYSGSKSALNTSLMTIGKEVVSKGIRINTVSPSDIKTPMTMNEELKQYRTEREKLYPKGYGNPTDVAEMVCFLLSNKTKWITCHDYIVDCGSF